MEDLGLSDPEVFETWHEEERKYLDGLSREPLVETLEMEYYQKLINLGASSYVNRSIFTTSINSVHVAGKT
jgi:hypothetical protein